MAWTVRFTRRAAKDLGKLDVTVARRVVAYLDEVARLSTPRQRGKALTGPYGGLWRYRVGDWRVICDLNDDTLTVLALSVTHRSKSYKS